jgi:hypothetical protein
MNVVFAADVIVVKRRDFEESPNPSYPNDKNTNMLQAN